MEQRDVVGGIVRDDAVVVVRIARRGIERLVAALRAADEVEPLGRAAVGLLDDLPSRRRAPFFTDSLPKLRSASSSIAKRAVESGRGLVAAVGAERDEALLQRVVHVRRLQREAGRGR